MGYWISLYNIEISKHECLGVFEYKTNICTSSNTNIITKNRSLFAYDGHSALLKFLLVNKRLTHLFMRIFLLADLHFVVIF